MLVQGLSAQMCLRGSAGARWKKKAPSVPILQVGKLRLGERKGLVGSKGKVMTETISNLHQAFFPLPRKYARS
jgi:hypothetical protein